MLEVNLIVSIIGTLFTNFFMYLAFRRSEKAEEHKAKQDLMISVKEFKTEV